MQNSKKFSQRKVELSAIFRRSFYARSPWLSSDHEFDFHVLKFHFSLEATVILPTLENNKKNRVTVGKNGSDEPKAKVWGKRKLVMMGKRKKEMRKNQTATQI